MADSPGTELQEKLRLLGASYIAELPDRILQLEAAWNELLQARDAGKLQTLHRMAHNLSGSGATFGFPDISEMARTLEKTLKDLMNQNAPTSAGQQALVVRQIGDLRRVVLSHAITLNS